jgi:hypothetical protein
LTTKQCAVAQFKPTTVALAMVEIHTVMLARYKSDKIGNNPAMLGYWAAELLERQCGAMWATERKGLEQPVLWNLHRLNLQTWDSVIP